MTAPDKMGQAAHAAAMLITGLDFKALGASNASLTTPQRAENARRFFSQWEALLPRVEAFKAAAPKSYELGRQDAEQAREIAGRGK